MTMELERGCIRTQGRWHMEEGRSVSGDSQKAFAVSKAENLELVVRQTEFKSQLHSSQWCGLGPGIIIYLDLAYSSVRCE